MRPRSPRGSAAASAGRTSGLGAGIRVPRVPAHSVPAGSVPAGLALAALAATALCVTPWAAAQSATRLVLERSDATIEIVNAGRGDQGARSILDLAGCVEGEAVRTNLFYAPVEGVTTRIDDLNEEGQARESTIVEAPLVIVVRPERGDGGDIASDENASDDVASEPSDDETLEALDATATFGRPPCLERVEPADPPTVLLRQGRTSVVGARFFLDRGSDVATMDGPVALTREPQSDGPPVEAEAESLRFDLASGGSTLTGGVRVTAGERVSEADELELDEEAGIAILRGDPAVSRVDQDEVRGRILIYDLETNDVVVEGGVAASFEIGGDTPP